jgi:hypothetical protein
MQEQKLTVARRTQGWKLTNDEHMTLADHVGRKQANKSKLMLCTWFAMARAKAMVRAN